MKAKKKIDEKAVFIDKKDKRNADASLTTGVCGTKWRQ